MTIRLKFGELLKARGVSAHRLLKTHRELSRNTIYSLANPHPGRSRLDLDVLAQAMRALEDETGQPVELSDVLELSATPAEQAEEHAERQAWLDAGARDLAQSLEAVEADEDQEELAAWLKGIEEAVTPGAYVSGVGFKAAKK